MKSLYPQMILLIGLALLSVGRSYGSDWLSLSASMSAAADEPCNAPPAPLNFCARKNKNCGCIDDDKGMGGKFNCGTCKAPETCGSNGKCGCTPLTCGDRKCGSPDDGCGHTLNCGNCQPGESCTAKGLCCTPKDCDGKVCGTIDQGCEKGPKVCMCFGSDTCDTNVIPNVCKKCIPKTCAGVNCGTITPGCNLPPLDCGPCCTPRACRTNECGETDLGCGTTKDCGDCFDNKMCVAGRCEPIPPPDTCKGGEPRCCGGECPPCGICPFTEPRALSFCTAKGKNCGLIDDGRGGQVDCGTCKGKSTCGGGGVPNVCGRPRRK